MIYHYLFAEICARSFLSFTEDFPSVYIIKYHKSPNIVSAILLHHIRMFQLLCRQAEYVNVQILVERRVTSL
jgi:hypothetical protein